MNFFRGRLILIFLTDYNGAILKSEERKWFSLFWIILTINVLLWNGMIVF